MALEPRKHCAGRRKDGGPCRIPASDGTDFCRRHADKQGEYQAYPSDPGATPSSERERWTWAVVFTSVLRSRLDAQALSNLKAAHWIGLVRGGGAVLIGEPQPEKQLVHAIPPFMAFATSGEPGEVFIWTSGDGIPTEGYSFLSEMEDHQLPDAVSREQFQWEYKRLTWLEEAVAAKFPNHPNTRCCLGYIFDPRSAEIRFFANENAPVSAEGYPDLLELLRVADGGSESKPQTVAADREGYGSSSRKANRLCPGPLPIQTGEETRALVEALACGGHGIGYEFLDRPGTGPLAVYRNPARVNGHQVWVTPPPDCSLWGIPELKAMTQGWDLSTVHVAMVVAAMLAVNAEKHADGIARGEVKPSISVATDEILDAMGRRRVDGATKWNEGRRMIRRNLLEISQAAVVGRRRKDYIDSATGTTIDTYWSEALFAVQDKETEWLNGQTSFDGSGIPVRLEIVGGRLWQTLARHSKMRQYISEIRILARLPVGQPSGQWAFAMLCTLLQKLRERKQTQELTLTRKDLLLTIPPSETPQMLKDKGKTEKILPRWKEAKGLLEALGISITEPPHPSVRYGWVDPWQLQEVLVTTNGDLLAGTDLPQLAAVASTRAAKDAKPKRQRGRPRKNAV